MAQLQTNLDGLESRPHPLRTLSASSDVTSRSISPLVPNANPPPAYIAPQAASDLIANEINQQVVVSPPALTLANDFLDQVLYNILSAARSTSLPALRTAVPAVLKPRLGKAALRVAEEELKEYLNDDEELELSSRAESVDTRYDFDLDLVWKLARLRCMVYARLGDVEEDDELEWLAKEQLPEQVKMAKSQNPQAEIEVGPASAIFLTSVIEYLGEQTLCHAAQYAHKRFQQSKEQIIGLSGTNDANIVVDGKDMNHVGRDSPLSRLWRSWRRNTRESAPRSATEEAPVSALTSPGSHSRTPSSAFPINPIVEVHSPSAIPLPMSPYDIDEIEVPGLAPGFSDDEEEPLDYFDLVKQRPSSLNVLPGTFLDELLTPEPPEIPARSPLRPTWTRKRSLSSPAPLKGKPQNSRDIIAKRDEASTRVYAQVVSASLAYPHSTAPFQDQIPTHMQPTLRPLSTDTNGQHFAAAADAGGPGAFTPSVYSRDGSVVSTHRKRPDSPTSASKKTVAEEMLQFQPSVKPPQDAQTGASITNIGDFDSMYVPIATPTESPSAPNPPVGLPLAQGVEYFQAPQKEIAGKVAVPADLRALPEAGEQNNMKQAPLRTLSGRLAPTEGAIGGTVHEPSTTSTKHDPVNLPVQSTSSRDVESPVSPIAASDLRPESSESTLPVPSPAPAQVPAPVHRSTLREIAEARNKKAGSRSSGVKPHSRASSNSSQVQGTTKDMPGRLQAVPQQRVNGTTIEEQRPVLSALDTNASQANHPDTSSSSGSKRINGKQYPLGEESDEAKKKSLEILIRSNETLHYTLTPAAAMRERDDQPLNQRNRASQSDQLEAVRPVRTPDATTSRVRPVALSSNPPNSTVASTASTAPVQRKVTPSSPPGAVTPTSPSGSKSRLGEPRDARGERSSATRDLADYARSTGPQDESQLPRSIGIRHQTSSSSKTPDSPTRGKTAPAQAASPTRAQSSTRPKFQARDARPSQRSEASDLIEFIREGPPGPAREHRIDRKVAPFRTTMDSEQFDTLARQQDNALNKRDSESSTRDGHAISSVDPSVNSQTPLVAPTGRKTNGVGVSAPTRQPNGDDDGMPKRTRRRIKDPYAIYDSDDEDLDGETSGPQSRNQQESLIDFLRNTAPPPGFTTPPILTSRAGQRSETANSSSVRETSPHLTQAGSKMDKYRPTQPTHAAHVDRNRSKPRLEARDAKATRANTAELAEYLKNSGPPANAQFKPRPFILSSTPNAAQTQAQTPPKLAAKEDNGLFKMFSKRRK